MSKSINIDERMKVITSLPAPTTPQARRRVVAMRMASGESVVMISRDMNIPARTIYGWLTNREYKEYIDKLRSAVLGEALGRAVDHSVTAVETIADLMVHPDASIRLRASGMLIETMVRLREHLEYDRRLRILEERYGQEIAGDGLEGDDFDGDGVGRPDGPAGAVGGDADGVVPPWEAELDRS
jgi:transposase-like protein